MAPPMPAMAPKTPNARARSFGIGERGGQDGQGRRGEDRGERTLQGAGADEELEALRRAAEGGGDGEADEADEEHAAATEHVGEPAAEQQQAAEGEGVGGDHPLAVVVAEPEVRLGGGQRDVHDGRVEHDHQLGEGDRREDEPAVPALRCGLDG